LILATLPKKGFSVEITPFTRRCASIALMALLPFSAMADTADAFRTPPDSARPWSFWFWINGNISREGITADLEAMAKAGIGGVLIMEVANPKTMAPDGPVKFASPEWNALFKHAVDEANRLGLQVNMNNDAGWCGSGGPWMTAGQSMKKLVSSTKNVTGPAHVDVVLTTPETVEDFYEDIEVVAVPEGDRAAENGEVPSTAIKLTDKMTSEGRVIWEAPAGKWQIARIGFTSTGKKNKPAPKSGEGLECEKFNAEALGTHFNAFIAKLADQNKELVGKAFVSTHIDSWEVGPQDWTANMAEEFRKRRGYGLGPWLPVLAKVDRGSSETLDRFRRDFVRTCAELNDEYYAGALRKLANEKGLKLSIEAYGQGGFLNPLTYGAEADTPVSEFWIERWDAWHLLSSKLLSSVAHVYGKPIVGAESFTSWPDKDPFTQHPFSVKTTGDWAMTQGVNRIIFHRTVHDPWANDDLVPGMSFAGYGWHVDRKQTWFEKGSAFMTYLARCQHILQSGQFVADVCRMVPDGEVRGDTPGMRKIPGEFADLPAGYNYDYISDRALLTEFSVKDGRLVTRAGMQYSALQLPEYTTMTLEVASKVAELVAGGAIVVGPKPTATPGLTNYPECDQTLQELAKKVWDENAEHHVIAGKSVGEVLEEHGLKPDFRFKLDRQPTDDSLTPAAEEFALPNKKRSKLTMPTEGLNWIHRRLPDGDYYFVANPQYRDVNAVCTFRAGDKAPEIWNPATGDMRTVAVFTSGEDVQVPIHFGPAESLFVVFRNPVNPAQQIVKLARNGEELFGPDAQPTELPRLYLQDGKPYLVAGQSGTYELKLASGETATVEVKDTATPVAINGPWTVEFQPNRGAPAKAEFDKLADWTKRSEEGIKYFSGNATYHTTFNVDTLTTANTQWELDLGDVQVIARVRLNGKDLGVLWKQPFTADVSSALRAGQNDLEVEVTNLWPNRMIGDEQYPDDCSKDGSWNKGPLKAWPDWIKNHTPRPEPRRITFTTFKYYDKDSKLLPSGLIGPVKLQPVVSYEVKPQ
jgi:hypothetical protein